jgi:hypothetical protein
LDSTKGQPIKRGGRQQLRERSGKRKIASSVQDDQGGEKTVVLELDVR